VLVVAVIVTLILLIFVIPQFESLFKGFGADLPAFTRMVIDLSMFVQTKGWAVGIVVGGGIAFYLYFKKRSKKLREFEDRLFLKLPIIGSILVKASIARLRPHAVDHVQRRRAAGRSPAIRGWRHRQHRLREGRAGHA
jgi:type IV pilus assembly protein PilC